MDANGLRELVLRLRTSASALAALTLALDAETTGEALDPAVAAGVEGVLRALGAEDAIRAAGPAGAAGVDGVLRALGAEDAVRAAGPAERLLIGEIRHFWLLDTKLVTGTTRRPGWTHTEPDVLDTAGMVTTPFAHAFRDRLAARLPGLVERLGQPGSAFLDVGCGVGRLAIEFARLWPALQVVAIDVWGPSLGLARDNVARSGVADRVELRELAGQDLAEVEAYDLAWIPSPFIPGDGPLRIAGRVLQALRPGGWLLYAMPRATPDPLSDALGRLRVTTFGGEFAAVPDVEAALAALGFTEVQTLPGPPSAPVAIVAARRPARP
jgi:SAM-dependent methyltransferase